MKLMDISERFIIYVTEQSFLISLTSLVAMELNIKAVFLGFSIAYRIDFVTGFSHIFDTYSGIYNLIIKYAHGELVSLYFIMHLDFIIHQKSDR